MFKRFFQWLFRIEPQIPWIPPTVNYMLPEEWYEEYFLYFLETTDTLGDVDEQWASHLSVLGGPR